MATGTVWTQHEIELTVASYLEMLCLELQGASYNKAERYRALTPLLQNRTKAAIEMRHQNISAVMIALHLPYISGYKPLSNVPKQLAEIVADQAFSHPAFIPLLNGIINRTLILDPRQSANSMESLSLTDEPPPDPVDAQNILGRIPRRLAKIDFVKREAENRDLGHAGELLVYENEKRRLQSEGRSDLVRKVEWISQTSGDGAGFDILSFDERTDRERLIEVKTTTQGKHFPFFVSRNEVRVSAERYEDYQLYRLFEFGENPRLYKLAGSLAKSCELDATQFEAFPRR